MACEWYNTEAFLIKYDIINDKYYIFVIQMLYLWCMPPIVLFSLCLSFIIGISLNTRR